MHQEVLYHGNTLSGAATSGRFRYLAGHKANKVLRGLGTIDPFLQQSLFLRGWWPNRWDYDPTDNERARRGEILPIEATELYSLARKARDDPVRTETAEQRSARSLKLAADLKAIVDEHMNDPSTMIKEMAELQKDDQKLTARYDKAAKEGDPMNRFLIAEARLNSVIGNRWIGNWRSQRVDTESVPNDVDARGRETPSRRPPDHFRPIPQGGCLPAGSRAVSNRGNCTAMTSHRYHEGTTILIKPNPQCSNELEVLTAQGEYCNLHHEVINEWSIVTLSGGEISLEAAAAFPSSFDHYNSQVAQRYHSQYMNEQKKRVYQEEYKYRQDLVKATTEKEKKDLKAKLTRSGGITVKNGTILDITPPHEHKKNKRFERDPSNHEYKIGDITGDSFMIRQACRGRKGDPRVGKTGAPVGVNDQLILRDTISAAKYEELCPMIDIPKGSNRMGFNPSSDVPTESRYIFHVATIDIEGGPNDEITTTNSLGRYDVYINASRIDCDAGRNITHSTDPNCRLVRIMSIRGDPVIRIVSIKSIRKGDTLTANLSESYRLAHPEDYRQERVRHPCGVSAPIPDWPGWPNKYMPVMKVNALDVNEGDFLPVVGAIAAKRRTSSSSSKGGSKSSKKQKGKDAAVIVIHDSDEGGDEAELGQEEEAESTTAEVTDETLTSIIEAATRTPEDTPASIMANTMRRLQSSLDTMAAQRSVKEEENRARMKAAGVDRELRHRGKPLMSAVAMEAQSILNAQQQNINENKKRDQINEMRANLDKNRHTKVAATEAKLKKMKRAKSRLDAAVKKEAMISLTVDEKSASNLTGAASSSSSSNPTGAASSSSSSSKVSQDVFTYLSNDESSTDTECEDSDYYQATSSMIHKQQTKRRIITPAELKREVEQIRNRESQGRELAGASKEFFQKRTIEQRSNSEPEIDLKTPATAAELWQAGRSRPTSSSIASTSQDLTVSEFSSLRELQLYNAQFTNTMPEIECWTLWAIKGILVAPYESAYFKERRLANFIQSWYYPDDHMLHSQRITNEFIYCESLSDIELFDLARLGEGSAHSEAVPKAIVDRIRKDVEDLDDAEPYLDMAQRVDQELAAPTSSSSSTSRPMSAAERRYRESKETLRREEAKLKRQSDEKKVEDDRRADWNRQINESNADMDVSTPEPVRTIVQAQGRIPRSILAAAEHLRVLREEQAQKAQAQQQQQQAQQHQAADAGQQQQQGPPESGKDTATGADPSDPSSSSSSSGRTDSSDDEEPNALHAMIDRVAMYIKDDDNPAPDLIDYLLMVHGVETIQDQRVRIVWEQLHQCELAESINNKHTQTEHTAPTTPTTLTLTHSTSDQ